MGLDELRGEFLEGEVGLPARAGEDGEDSGGEIGLFGFDGI